MFPGLVWDLLRIHVVYEQSTNRMAADGKEMNLEVDRLNIKSVVEEVDRHSRVLQKQADLNI